MKKKVRIYKAPDGKGKFVNKTAKFLHKAQQGGQQDQQAQMAQYVYKTLDDAEPFEFDIVKESLINELAAAKIPIEQAEDMVENIATNLQAQTAEADQLAGDVYDQGQEDLKAQEEAEAAAEEERQAGLADDYGYYDDTAAQGEDDEDEEDYDDEEEASYMQAGGDIIPDDNPVSFTGYNPNQYTLDKGQSFSHGGMTKRKYVGQVMKLLKKAQEGQEAKDEKGGFDPKDTADNKKENLNKGFVNALANTAKEAKMKEQAEAMWKQQQQQFAQDGIETGWQKPKSYEDYKPKTGWSRGSMTDAEKEYEKEWLENYEYPRHGHSGLKVSDVEKGNYPGGYRSAETNAENENEYNRRNQARQGNIYNPRQIQRMMPRGFGRGQMRSFAGMVPPGGFFPMGMNIMTYPMMMPEQKPIHVQGTIPGMKLDVRKSHWLTGRPSQYSLEFGGDGAIPGFGMMPGIGYGYKSTQRRTIEGVSKLVNKAADPANDLNKNKTPDWDKDGNGTPDNIQSNIIPSTPGTPTAYDRNANNVLDVTEVKTNLPAVNTNPNKDAVGDNSKLPPKPQAKKVNTATKSKQAGQNKPVNNNTVTNKNKVATTPPKKEDSSKLVSKQSSWKKPAASYTAPAYDINSMIPSWLKQAIINNESSGDANYSNPADYRNNWLYKQAGGFVDSSNPDLYKFVYGGDDVITQQDMNYSDSRNTGSPFFAYGGMVHYQNGGGKVTDYDKDGNGIPDLIERTPGKNPEEKKEEKKKDEPKKSEFQAITSKEDYDKRLADEKKKWQDDYTKQNQSSNSGGGGYDPYGGYVRRSYRPNAFGTYFPANTVRRLGTWSQQQGMPYDPRTGAAYFGGFGPGTQLSKIDVRKSGWLSGRPKKYTMYFNNAEMDPTKPQFSINTGAGASSDTGSASQSAGNKKATNAKEFFGYSDAEWDKMSAREKRQEKRNMKSQEWVDSLPDPETKDNEFEGDIGTALTPSGPSAEDIAARDAATEANKGVIRNFSEVEGVQDDPFGIGMGGPSEEPSDFEESTQTYDSPEAANEYVQGEWGDIMTDVSEVLGPESQQEFDQFLATNPSKGQIDAKIEDFMRQRNQVIGKDAEALERDALTADAEEEMMNEEAMRRNPMFMGSSGAPAANPNFGATPEIATGQDYQLSDREKADMDYIMQNRRSAPIDFQPRSGRLTESNIFSNRDQVIPNTRKPSEDLANLAYTDSLPALPASPLETANYEDMLLNNFPQYTDAFEGAASNDEQYLPGTMDGMSEGSVRNREIAAKQKYNQQQAAIRQQQLLQQQQQQQVASGSKSGSGKSSNAALKEKALNSNRQAKQSGNWTDDWDIKGVISKNKNQLETLKDSPIGAKTSYAIEKRWENLSNAQRKKYKNFNNFLKTEGYDKFYNAINSKQSGGNTNLNRFVYGDEVTKTSTGTPSPVVYTNNPALEGLRDVDLVGSNTAGITNLQSPSFWSDQQSFNQPTMDFQTGCTEEEKKDPKSACYDMEKYGMKVQEDALGSARETTEKRYAPKAGQFAVDFKNKNTYEVDARGTALSANALGKGIFGALDRRSSNKLNKNFYDAFTSDNLYASDPSRDRGDYETNSGLYRPNEQGQIWNSRSKQLGGFMQEGGFIEGDVVDMTPEELEEFIANGGEVEIIS